MRQSKPGESGGRSGIAALRSAGAIVLAMLMMSWVGIWNGFPLLYPDSMTYMDDGRLVARALFLGRRSAYYGIRSFLYSLGILPFHWNLSPWPVVALQAMLAAWLLWLTVRSILVRRLIASYLGLVAALSLFTTLSWYVPLILPDILGALLYLSIYLIVFARESISRLERWGLYLISWWSIASHATHLLLGCGVCLLLAVLALFQKSGPVLRRRRFESIGEIALVFLAAALSQLALNAYLYGHPSLNGERPPFLAARIVADGPGRWYLNEHCNQLDWVICRHLNQVSSDPDNFLWGSDGIWPNLTEDESRLMMQQEMPFVIATLREYPIAELKRASRSAWEQLGTFGLNDLDPSGYTLSQFPYVLPKATASYLRGRQGRNIIPLDEITSLQFWFVIATLPVIAIFAPGLWRRRAEVVPARMIGLGLIIFVVELANAAVTSTLSMVEDRFEARVIWLAPMLAGLMALEWSWTRRNDSSKASIDQRSA